MVPRVGSPVIDAGANGSCEPGDQRGAPRPLDGDGVGGANCDIGAVEVLPCDIASPDEVLTNFVVSPPFANVSACYTITVGPAVDVLGGAILGLFTRNHVVFRNGFSIQAGGELVVLLFPDSGSSVTLP